MTAWPGRWSGGVPVKEVLAEAASAWRAAGRA